MSDKDDPVVLELAQLSREQIGPFLLLGLDKDAAPETIEAHWAQRVIWARKNNIKIPLQDIHWAREMIKDPARRLKADAASLNADTTEGILRKLAESFGVEETPRSTWEPIDVEKDLSNYTPAAEIPKVEEVRGSITLPPLPREIPVVAHLLEQWIKEPMNPWNLELPLETDKVIPT